MLPQILQDYLDSLRSARPNMEGDLTENAEDRMELWRKNIDEIDHAILYLINQRSEVANSIGDIKHANGWPVYMPEREVLVVDKAAGRNPGPLPDASVKRIWERIIDETRSVEKKLYSEMDKPEEDDK